MSKLSRIQTLGIRDHVDDFEKHPDLYMHGLLPDGVDIDVASPAELRVIKKIFAKR